jgi:hypothetical protein
MGCKWSAARSAFLAGRTPRRKRDARLSRRFEAQTSPTPTYM